MKNDPYVLIWLINIFEFQSLFCNTGFTGVIGFYYCVHINDYGKIPARKSNTKNMHLFYCYLSLQDNKGETRNTTKITIRYYLEEVVQ